MRAAFAVGVMAILAVLAFNRSIGPAVGPDTPVLVRSADPIKVLLPIDPDRTTISGYVYGALADAAKAEVGPLAADLRTMAEDADLIDWIASSGTARFVGKQAAALAYPVYRVTVEPERVTITTATVELLPQYWNLGGSIAHEDGHALINEMLARACGPSLVADLAVQ